VNKIEEWQKAWAAAMIDSRGHLITKKNKQRAPGSQQIVLMIETKHHEIAERLAAMTGTSPEPQESSLNRREDWNRKGCAEHCPEPHIHVGEPVMPMITRWAVTGTSAAIVLWNIRKYMATTREPWDWGLDQCLRQLRLEGPGSGSVKSSARRLSQLGWELPPVLADMKGENP